MSEYSEFDEPWDELLFELDRISEKHEASYADPASDEEIARDRALDIVSEYSESIILDGALPLDLAEALSWYQPTWPLDKKVRELLAYNTVLRRVGFELTKHVLNQLQGANRRLEILTATVLLLRSGKKSLTALKYMRQASRLYLAGYDAEVFIMCSATLEAALAERIPDELLAAHGEKPKYPRTGGYSIGQRMKVEKNHLRVFTQESRADFWKVVNWRNDAAHVQLDIAGNPGEPVAIVAYLLTIMFPA